jgi:death on curing protein
MTKESSDFELVYLKLDHVLELYGLIVGATAKEAGDQLRNHDGLESALTRPETYAHYEAADLALQAAVLAHGLAEGQHFIDANKRVALVAMLTFLELNGWRVEVSDPVLADWILSFSSDATPEHVAELIRVSLVEAGAEPAPDGP